jgi:hypothetical protein
LKAGIVGIIVCSSAGKERWDMLANDKKEKMEEGKVTHH